MQFGCLSSRYFYKCLDDIYTSVGKHTKPPVSLAGQVRFKFSFILGSDNNTRYGPGLLGMDHVNKQVLGLAMSLRSGSLRLILIKIVDYRVIVLFLQVRSGYQGSWLDKV